MKLKYTILALVCALAVLLGGCGQKQSMGPAKKAEQADPVSESHDASRHGTAVVFGDSYFNNPIVGYEFGDWLAENGPYETVYNHAYEGSGFGDTFQYRQGCSLYELLISGTGTTPDGKTAYEDIRQHVSEADVIYIHLGGNDFLSAVSSGFVAPILEESDVRSKVRSVFNEINRLNDHAVIYCIPAMTLEQLAQGTQTKLGFGDTDEGWLNRLKAVRDVYVGIAESDANVYIAEQGLDSLVYKRTADGMHPTKEAADIAFQQILNMKYRNKLLREMLVVVDATLAPDSDEKAWTQTVRKDLFDNAKLFYIIQNNGLFANSTQQALYSSEQVWDVMVPINGRLAVGKFRWDDGITFTLDGYVPLN